MTYKISEWESGSGSRFYAACVDDLGHDSGTWYFIPRILKMDLVDYLTNLLNDYKANFTYNKESKNIQIWWAKKDYHFCHKFTLDYNRKLRNI